LAEAHIKEVEQKAAEILAMKSALEHLVHCCHGDDRPEWPILDGLAAEGAVPSRDAPSKRRVRTTRAAH
jgi:MerR family copper efflux transcriptional regulator